jgi:hypothetical protein
VVLLLVVFITIGLIYLSLIDSRILAAGLEALALACPDTSKPNYTYLTSRCFSARTGMRA